MRIHALLLGPFIFGSRLLASELAAKNNKIAQEYKSVHQRQVSASR